jgi:MOSC domain-containing protein YiiM
MTNAQTSVPAETVTSVGTVTAVAVGLFGENLRTSGIDLEPGLRHAAVKISQRG